jgi:hypothetical protein
LQTIEQGMPLFKQNNLFPVRVPVLQGHDTTVTQSTSVTLTAAQVATGYVKCASASAITLTLPTGTLLGAYLGAQQGDSFELIIDNTAGTSTGVVTIGVGTNAVLSAAAVAGSTANFGLITVPVGATGIGVFRILFASGTAYVFSRVA